MPEESYKVPFGKARVLSPGKDITIVGISHMALECVRAKHLLEDAGIDAEVIDPVSLSPLDIDDDRGSVERTGRLLVVDTGWTELRRLVRDPVRGVRAASASGANSSPSGWAICRRRARPPRSSRTSTIPSPQSIADAAYRLVRGASARPGSRARSTAAEVAEFRGPF